MRVLKIIDSTITEPHSTWRTESRELCFGTPWCEIVLGYSWMYFPKKEISSSYGHRGVCCTTFIAKDPFLAKLWITIMTSSTGNILRVTGPLCGEFTGHRWIPPPPRWLLVTTETLSVYRRDKSNWIVFYYGMPNRTRSAVVARLLRWEYTLIKFTVITVVLMLAPS